MIKFDEREKFIFENRIEKYGQFDKKMTLREIAEHFGVTTERIRQMEAKIYGKFSYIIRFGNK